MKGQSATYLATNKSMQHAICCDCLAIKEGLSLQGKGCFDFNKAVPSTRDYISTAVCQHLCMISEVPVDGADMQPCILAHVTNPINACGNSVTGLPRGQTSYQSPDGPGRQHLLG